MDIGKLKPLQGHAFVGMETKYGDMEGIIWIPEKARRVLGKIGICTAYTPWEKKLYEVWEEGKLVAREAYRWNDLYEGIIGKQVVIETGRIIQGCLYDVRLEHIHAIDPDCEAEFVMDHEIPRCPRCKSKGELNILLGSDGYCPVCQMNTAGDLAKDAEVGISDQEAHDFGGTKEDYLKRGDPNRGKETSRIVTYVGMDRRS